MKKYKVEVCFTAWAIKTVEAENEDEAIKKACASFSTFGCTDAEADVEASFVATEEEITESNA